MTFLPTNGLKTPIPLAVFLKARRIAQSPCAAENGLVILRCVEVCCADYPAASGASF